MRQWVVSHGGQRAAGAAFALMRRRGGVRRGLKVVMGARGGVVGTG